MGGLIENPQNPLSAVEARALLTRIAAGDRQAFEVFARATTPFVHGRVSKIIWDTGVAEDATQAVLLKVWTHAGRFSEGRGNAFAWLTTICRNTAIDHLRSEDRIRRIDAVAEKVAETQTPSDGVLTETIHREDQREIYAALSMLNPSQQNAIKLAYFEGLTYVEVAEQLGEPEGTVKARIRRGMIQLARLLGETHVS